MSEHVQGDQLSVRDAVVTLQRAQAYEGPLRRRTEGVTWIVWGLVTAAIQLSFAAAHNWFANPEWMPTWYFALVLLGWPTLGVALTAAVWRIALVGSPELAPERRRSVWAGVLWLPFVYVAWALAFALGMAISLVVGDGAAEAAMPLVGVGGAWLLLGGLNIYRATPTGRRVVLAVGAAILVPGLAVAALGGGLPHGGWPLAEVLTIVVGGGAPVLGGLWQTLRG